MLITYDDLADVLYIIFKKSISDETSIDDNFVIVRRLSNEIISLTIDGFNARIKEGSWDDSHILKYKDDLNIKELDKFKNE